LINSFYAYGRKALIRAHVPAILLTATFLVLGLPCLLYADLRVQVLDVSARDAAGVIKTSFMPGEIIQYRVQFLVLEGSGDPFTVHLRVMGAGWVENLTQAASFGLGVHTVVWQSTDPPDPLPLQVSLTACQGKVGLHLDVHSDLESISVQGRRHGYFTTRCPGGLPTGVVATLPVGGSPYGMAHTVDGRFLYVTCDVNHTITVIDTIQRSVVKTIEIGFQEQDGTWIEGSPTGIAVAPNWLEMLVADYYSARIYRIRISDHTLLEDNILLDRFGAMNLTDMTYNPRMRNIIVADYRGARVFAIDSTYTIVLPISLANLLLPTTIGTAPLKVCIDPASPFNFFVLCQLFNEVVKATAFGVKLDGVILKDVFDPLSQFPSWSMAVNPMRPVVYVVVNPGSIEFDLQLPGTQSKIYARHSGALSGGWHEEYLVGTSVWDLAVSGDGRYGYAVDSYLGQVLVLNLDTGEELQDCALTVDAGANLLLADTVRNRLFVGNWLTGTVDIVE